MDDYMQTFTAAGEGGDAEIEKEAGFSPKERGLAYTYIAIGLLGFLGNSFVILVIAKHTKMLNLVTNIYIMNQSSVDAACSLVLIFTYIFNNEGAKQLSGVLGTLTCSLWVSTSLLWVLMVSSTTNLIAVSIERYLAVTRPIWHKISFTRKKALRSLPFIWLCGPIFSGVYLFPTNVIVDGQCYTYSHYVSETWRMVGGVYLFMLQFGLPLTVFSFCYGRMAMVLRRGNKVAPLDEDKDVGGHRVVPKSKMTAKAYNNVLRILVIVVACFICCWSINQIYFLLHTLGLGYPYIDFSSNFYHFTVMLTFSNSCVNPFIYAAKYKQFQDGVRALLGIQARETSSMASQSKPQTSTKP